MDRRKQYRVRIGEADGLEAGVVMADGSIASGQPLDLMLEGAGIRFSGHGFPALVLGLPVTLCFTSKLLEKPLQVSARVLYRTEEVGARRYGFRFIDRRELESQLPREIYRLFNRRGSHRVAPDVKSPVEITVEAAHGDPIPVELLNISATGMSIRVPTTVESSLVETRAARFTVTLPHGRDPLCLYGSIRDRRLDGQEIHYNIEFDLDRTEDAERQQDLIIDYVMARQKEIWLSAKAA